MNKKFLSIGVFLAALIFITPFIDHVVAAPGEPIDSCIGVDHPPFDEAYDGDGYSYLKLGLTMPLESYDEGSEFMGELTGSGNTVTSSNTLDANGQLFFVFPLYAYGAYDVMVYDVSGDMVFQSDVTVDDTEPECDPELLSVSPPKEVSTETEAPEATSESETTDTSETETESETTGEEEVGETTETSEDEASESDSEVINETSWWPLALIAIGVPLIIIGLWHLLKKTCVKERNAWLAAAEKAAEASEKARKAEDAAEKLSEEREKLDDELEDIRETYPSAGKPDGEEAWIEMEGRRITSRDVAMRREAERAAWDKYRSDPDSESAEALQEEWKEAAKPQSEEERRELDEKAKKLEEAIKKAKETEDEAVKKAKEAKKVEDEAKGKEESARLVYEACMKAAMAPPKPETGSGSTPGTTGGSTGEPGSTSGEDETPGCKKKDPPREKNRKNLGRVSIPVELDAGLRGGEAHKGAKAAEDISDQLADASTKLGYVSKLMDIKGIGQTLVRDGVGWSLVKEGGPPAAGQALDVPVPTSPGQLAVDALSLLGKISSVIIKKVPELQERRLTDCDLYPVIRYKAFKAECVEIWVCKNDQWVKDRTRFSLTYIGNSSGRMSPRTGCNWAQAQEVIRRCERVFRGKLANALDELAKKEAGCR